MANTQQKFKCTEIEGYYSSTQPLSEDDILKFAQDLIEKRFQRGATLTSPQDSIEHLKSKLAHFEHEVFAVIFLDTKHRIIAFEKLFTGTIDQATVYPREVAKRALCHNAAAVIFSHNHPSGNTTPSNADISLNDKLKSAMDILSIRALDHIIVGGNNSTSLANEGLF